MHLQEWKDRFERLQERFPMLSALDQKGPEGWWWWCLRERVGWSQGSWMFKMFILFEVKVSSHKITEVGRGTKKSTCLVQRYSWKSGHEGHLKLVARNLGNLGFCVCHVEGCVFSVKPSWRRSSHEDLRASFAPLIIRSSPSLTEASFTSRRLLQGVWKKTPDILAWHQKM